MSSAVSSKTLELSRSGQTTRIGDLRFDWLMAVLSAVFIGGLYLDGWAHNHGRVDTSFFTPWHAFFYGGFFLVGVGLLGVIVLNRTRGYSLARAIPDGHRLTLIGLLVFAAGGLGDMFWHEIFGIEEEIEALFSPTHLLLGIGIGLIVTGPIRAAWQRRGSDSSWRALGPAILALGLLAATFTFFLMFSFPVTVVLGAKGNPHFQDHVGQVAGLVGMILTAALLFGPLLLSLLRWRLPLGALTLILGLAFIGGTVVDYETPLMIGLAGGMAVGAALVDYVAWRAHPRRNPQTIRWLALAMPLLVFGGYYAVLLPTVGTLWTVHMWTATVAIPAVGVWLLTFLILPPEIPTDAGPDAPTESRGLE